MLEDIDNGEGVTEHLQSLRTHRRTELSAEVVRIRNEATSRRHRLSVAKRNWSEVG